MRTCVQSPVLFCKSIETMHVCNPRTGKAETAEFLGLAAMPFQVNPRAPWSVRYPASTHKVESAQEDAWYWSLTSGFHTYLHAQTPRRGTSKHVHTENIKIYYFQLVQSTDVNMYTSRKDLQHFWEVKFVLKYFALGKCNLCAEQLTAHLIWVPQPRHPSGSAITEYAWVRKASKQGKGPKTPPLPFTL